MKSLIEELITPKKWTFKRRIMLKVFDSIPIEEICSTKFLQCMLNSMITSHFKYGNVSDCYPKKVSAIKSLKERLKLYERTGNADWLIDVSNFAMIEFMHPAHPKFHHRPTSAKESPGLRPRFGD